MGRFGALVGASLVAAVQYYYVSDDVRNRLLLVKTWVDHIEDEVPGMKRPVAVRDFESDPRHLLSHLFGNVLQKDVYLKQVRKTKGATRVVRDLELPSPIPIVCHVLPPPSDIAGGD